ncbi:MAG: tRNA (guanosine(46)-N7)-methyltransferase TrmB [Lachnospiraceae bacterium]|nr:tRNA (guanosine(46)-N7)-methyltransferase TrmB [Lachnospiraceae bacterium]
MRLRKIAGAEDRINASPSVIREPEAMRGLWKKEVFQNGRPLYVEIGSGKGRFLMEMAALHPEVNFLGIEKFPSVLLRAVEKYEETPRENVRFLRFDAEAIETVLSLGEADRIYLNFSDPWPKDRHHKRRLTSREFLKRYEAVLALEGIVEFKTDNVGLFEFSLREIEASGWEVLSETRDLHKSPMNEGNVMTEYEEKFSILGNKICKLITRPKKKEACHADTEKK